LIPIGRFARFRIETPRRVVAAHEFTGLVPEHEFDVVVKRFRNEIGQRFACEGDGDKVRAHPLHPNDFHLAVTHFMADPSQRGRI